MYPIVAYSTSLLTSLLLLSLYKSADDGVVEREAAVASTIETSVASVPPLAIDAPASVGGEVASDTLSHSPPVSEDSYQLLLKCDGRTVTIDNVTPSTTIDTLKDKIHDKTAFPPDTFRLTDGKNDLEVGKTLLNSGLESGSTIYLCQRLLGSVSVMFFPPLFITSCQISSNAVVCILISS